MRLLWSTLLLVSLLLSGARQPVMGQSIFSRLFSWEKGEQSKQLQCGFMPAYNKRKAYNKYARLRFGKSVVKKTEENRNKRLVPTGTARVNKRPENSTVPEPTVPGTDMSRSSEPPRANKLVDEIPTETESKAVKKLTREALKRMTLQQRRDTLENSTPEIVLPPIQFISGQDEFSVVNMDSFMQAMEYAQQGKVVLVEGHTDDLGSAAYNLELSMKRSEKIRTLLLSGGVADELISVIGYGESQPIVPNNTTANRAINRRIEFKIFSVE